MKITNKQNKHILKWWSESDVIVFKVLFDYLDEYFPNAALVDSANQDIEILLYQNDEILFVLTITWLYNDVRGYAAIDFWLEIRSKLLFNKTIESDSWYALERDLYEYNKLEYYCVYIERLSYIKWCQIETNIRPKWWLTCDGINNNIFSVIKDLDDILISMYKEIVDTESLLQYLDGIFLYTRPTWVKYSLPNIEYIKKKYDVIKNR